MWELVKAGGWLMMPIMVAAVLALGICIERGWALRSRRVAPPDLLPEVWNWIRNKQLNAEKLRELKAKSPLGEILAAGLLNSRHGREIMKESIEETANVVIHHMQRYLSLLGTLAIIVEAASLLVRESGWKGATSFSVGIGWFVLAVIISSWKAGWLQSLSPWFKRMLTSQSERIDLNFY